MFGVEPKWYTLNWVVATEIFFFEFSPRKIGEIIEFDLRMFFNWVGEKPPTSED